jgi:hypothetical protein
MQKPATLLLLALPALVSLFPALAFILVVWQGKC